MNVPKYKIKKVGSEWWIIDKSNTIIDKGAIGPYFTRPEAVDDKLGLIRFDEEYKRK